MTYLSFRQSKGIFLDAVRRFQEDEASRFGASLAYYAVFSLAPLLSVAIGIAGMVFGTTNAEKQILDEMGNFLGPDGEALLAGAVHATDDARIGAGVTAVSFLLILFGAASVFKELKDALNRVFDAPGKKSDFIEFLKKNLLSFGMVLAIGFLLLISLLLSVVVTTLGTYASGVLPFPAVIWESLNFLISFGLSTILFLCLYRYVSDIRIGWHESLVGAIVTALLFALGKTLIGAYLGRSGIASTYGAAGSIVLILLWVYYSSYIVLFGAELTAAYAAFRGKLAARARLKEQQLMKKGGVVRMIASTLVLFIARRIMKRFLRRR